MLLKSILLFQMADYYPFDNEKGLKTREQKKKRRKSSLRYSLANSTGQCSLCMILRASSFLGTSQVMTICTDVTVRPASKSVEVVFPGKPQRQVKTQTNKQFQGAVNSRIVKHKNKR